MIEPMPRHWYSWHYDLMEGVTRLAEFVFALGEMQGQLTVGRNTFTVYRQGLFKGAFLLESNGSILAQDEKPSVFWRWLDIQHQGRHYILRTVSVFGRKLVLLDGSVEIGSLTPRGLFSGGPRSTSPRIYPLH